MAYVKQTWIDETSIVNAEKLNYIEGGIYENSLAIDNMRDGEVYSTSEVKTNKVWIDGKPIYRKVYTGTTGSGYATNIDNNLNFGAITSCSGWVGNDTVGYMYLGNYLNANYSGGFYIDGATGRLQIYTSTSTLQSKPYTVVIEYTKTTD